MYRIVYISTATENFSKEQLLELLEKGRMKNDKLGITGILIYNQGHIIQVLEGEELIVRELFKSIAADPRHEEVNVLLEEPIKEREFPDWSMAFRDMALEKDKFPGFSAFMNAPLTKNEFKSQPNKV